MVKPEWGAKHGCPKCGTRFYDLGKDDPVTCIECGHAWQPEPVLKSKQPIPSEEVKKAPEVADVDLAEEDLDLDEDGILKPLPPASPLDVRRRVFCNRSLNMKSIRAVGFDMDYTLAQYKPESFEALAYRLTVDKLVSVFGYPALIKEFEFDWRYMVS